VLYPHTRGKAPLSGFPHRPFQRPPRWLSSIPPDGTSGVIPSRRQRHKPSHGGRAADTERRHPSTPGGAGPRPAARRGGTWPSGRSARRRPDHDDRGEPLRSGRRAREADLPAQQCQLVPVVEVIRGEDDIGLDRRGRTRAPRERGELA